MHSFKWGITIAIILLLSGCQYNTPDYGEAAKNNTDTEAEDGIETTTTEIISWNGVVTSIDEDLKIHLETTTPEFPHKEIALAAIELPIVRDHVLSREVQQILTDLLVAETVRIEVDLKDPKNTDIPHAYIYIDDMRVQDLLVRSGLAFLDGDNTMYTSHLMTLQEEAIDQLKGIWANKSSSLSDSILTGIKENMVDIIESSKN
ncbi:thermonuclease family protein [Lysinibacillus sphaericus]|uniref:TNase-like domain-containing protein n=1 Tax=Lysinibacillus sphaericus TaxID=1421 RepID=A0A6G9ZZQ3_LYSSH|nr:thermonuclease family protein [Lysinibacillus sphaericus]QIS31262.1 hypothetical protein [Lysinibacillus sphaericus]QPA61355.1 thermonuclease family protein [Lysinibacillus sphaericus]